MRLQELRQDLRWAARWRLLNTRHTVLCQQCSSLVGDRCLMHSLHERLTVSALSVGRPRRSINLVEAAGSDSDDDDAPISKKTTPRKRSRKSARSDPPKSPANKRARKDAQSAADTAAAAPARRRGRAATGRGAAGDEAEGGDQGEQKPGRRRTESPKKGSKALRDPDMLGYACLPRWSSL
jgi:hypothetical protein